MIELVRDLRVINVLTKFENDPWKIMDVRVLTGLVCPAARPSARPPVHPLGVRQYPGALKGCGVKMRTKSVHNLFSIRCVVHSAEHRRWLSTSIWKLNVDAMHHLFHSIATAWWHNACRERWTHSRGDRVYAQLKTSYRWLSARLQYLQCVINGDTAV